MIVADALTGTAGEDLSKYRLVRVSSATTPATYKHCQPGDQPIGVNEEDVASDGRITVHLLLRLGSIEVEAHEAITQHANVYPGPAGRVAASGIGRPIGIAMTSASAQGDIIDILPLPATAPSLDEFAIFDDFFGLLLTGAEAPWKSIVTDSGTFTVLDAAGGVLQLEASDGTIGDNDEAYAYTQNELFCVAAGKPMYFEARVKLGAADAADAANVMVGVLSGVAANAILDNGAGPPANYDGVVLYKIDGGTAWAAEASVGATQTAIALTAPGRPGTSYQKVGILVVPTSSTSATAYIFVDGVLVGSQAFTFTGMTEMAAFVGVKNGGTAVNTTLHVDYVLCRQAR
jgi:hypothetical protein